MNIPSVFQLIRDFRKDTRGSVAVETVIMWPALFLALMAMAVLFDAYRARSTTEKAAFAVSDMLSRETAAVDSSYIDGVHTLFEEISTLRGEQEMTVSLVSWDSNTNAHDLEWSHSTLASRTLTDADLPELGENLPTLVPGESLIVVQTFGTYAPPVIMKRWWGDDWDGFPMNTFVFTRPRFVANLAWNGA
ncbi:pilus assembly protein [Shimia sp. R9_2]|uniref:TadE/TadG family type IV pilus assembly protein n=1 Tax=Shimia sp. R9_2 TaxID=2821112 RepID=UPI001ADD5F16|nr:TadE/TadG family type IV pilus assembly protein [Shimia sp. R9_2]MBO9396216.1 pilus assembly protein [Shimia sp. R9_2]